MRSKSGIMERRLQAGIASVTAFALAACSGQASLPSSKGGILVKQVTLQTASFAANNATTAALLRRSDAAPACSAGNFALGGADDVFMHVSGTLNNGQSVYWHAEDYTLGYTNWITSPIAGGYNISEIQANEPGLSAAGHPFNFLKSVTITTNGNTSVTYSVPADSSAYPGVLTVLDNGAPVNNIPLNAYTTLSRGEIVGWTGPYLSETVYDAATGGTISMAAVHRQDTTPGMDFIDVQVTATNVILGGYLMSAALGGSGGGASCTLPPIANPLPGVVPTPTPVPGAPAPTPVPTQPPLCVLPIATSPNPHPTPNANGGACSS